MKVAAIVEGDGEVAALPVLLRRIGEWRTPGYFIHVVTPIRVRRDQFLNRDKEFSRHLSLAAGKCGEYGEMTDQPAFSARMDLQQAFDRSRSFRKLCAEWVRQTA